MIKVSPLILGSALASLLFVSCTSGRVADGQSVEGRREFELKKYRDPATGSIPVNIRALEVDFAQTLPGAVGNKDGSEVVQDLGSWQQRGPWNIGGRTRALAMDASDSKVILAGAVSGGLWRSTDEGASWSRMTKSNQLHTVTTVAQDTRDGHKNVWYYGTGEIYGNSSQISGNGIWKSVDGGGTWSVLPSTLSASTPSTNQFAYTWRIVTASPQDSGEVYVATAQSGIYRSTNGGTTWTGVAGSNALFTDVAVTPNGTLYAAFSGFTGQTGSVSSRWGVFRSTDGLTWTKITPPEMKNTVKRIVLAAVPQHPDQIYVLAETPGIGAKGTSNNRGKVLEEWHSLWKYTYSASNGSDGGRQWEDRSANIPLSEEARGDFYSQGGYDLLIRVSPFDSNLVVVGGTNLYRSTDGFKTTSTNAWIGGYGKTSPFWDRYSLYKNHHPDQHDVLFHPTKPSTMISVNDGGIMRTDDIRAADVAWTELNRGYLTTQFYTIDQEPYAGSAKLVGGMQDNATWTTASANVEAPWTRLGGGDGAYCYFADSGRTQYYSSQQGRMYKIFFDQNGAELDRARIDPAVNGYLDYLFINPYVLHPTDQHMMYLAGGQMLWRNSDVRGIPPGKNDSTSINWDSLSATNLGPTTVQISSVCATTSTDSQHHVVYYGTTDGRIFRLDSAEKGQPKPVEI
ncbi:MAG: sialidase family protein, partial [Candidatus Kapabacteria bacterium]|nr:sialidase family protein [Candidatus Kapabacteria bacterium]